MGNHWLRNIVIQLYTSNLLETQRFYSSILSIHSETLSSTQLILSLESVRLIFSTATEHSAHNTQNLSFEVSEIDKLWETIKLQVHVLKPIADTDNGAYREFTIQDNNGYPLHFFEKNLSHQLSFDLYHSHQ